MRVRTRGEQVGPGRRQVRVLPWRIRRAGMLTVRGVGGAVATTLVVGVGEGLQQDLRCSSRAARPTSRRC